MNKVEIIEVSPEKAKHWMENLLPGQRKISKPWVEKLVGEVNNNWKINNDAITIINGKLANGQHRCSAIIQANKAVNCLVLETDENNAFDTMDNGRSRSMIDLLNFYNFANSGIISSSAKIIIAYDKGLFSWRGIADGRNQKSVDGEKIDCVTYSEILKFCQDNKDIMNKYANFVLNLYKDNPYLYPSYALALLFIASRENEKKAEEFISSVYLGTSDDVCFDMRNRLIKNKISRTKLARPTIFGLLIKSYNMYLKGERLSHIRVEPKSGFPKI